jgi:hypothetical protein
MKAITLYVVLAFAFSSVFYTLIIASARVVGGHGGTSPCQFGFRCRAL